MSKNKQNVPKLRFPGFTGAWEQRKLGDLADIVRGASPRPIQDPKWFDVESDVGWLRISDVTEQDGRIYYLEQRISKAGQEKTRVLTEPHLLLSIAATVGKPVVNYVKTGVHDGFLIFQNPKFDREFMFQWLEVFRPNWQKYGQPGSQVNLNSDLVKNQEIMLPSEVEQKKIGDFFSRLDNLITLHQRKLNNVTKLKAGLLQKMFPKNGENIPEIRFPGFTGAWEQRKLRNIAISTYGGGTPTTSNEEYWNGKIPWIRSSDLSENEVFGVSPSRYISEAGLRNSAAKLVPKNSIAIITRVGVGKLALMPYSYTTSQDFLSLSDLNIDPWFGAYACYEMLQSVLHKVQGTAIKGITKDELLEKTISVPSINEQMRIGVFFKQLDNLITLHQRKLEHLQEQKKALLQQMFV